MMKEHTLADATQAYRRALPPGELIEISTAPLDRIGVPARVATFFARDGRVRGGLGYGVTDEAALVGALGEMTEEFAASRAVMEWPRETGSFDEMTARFGAEHVADPRSLCLHAGSSYTADMPLQWLETRRWLSGETVWVPLEFVATYKGDVSPEFPPLVTPITNGLGAGLTLDQAILHGLLELLQRDGNGVSIRALATGDALDLSTVDDTEARALLDKLDAAGIDVVVKVAATDFGIPNLYAVGIDREAHPGAQPIMAAGGGEAAHPVAAVALRKALLEFSAARARMAFFHGPLEQVAEIAPEGYLDRMREGFTVAAQEPRALAEMRRWLSFSLDDMRALLEPRVLHVERKIAFGSLPGMPESEAHDRSSLLREVASRLEAAGLEILVADFSDYAAKGVYAVKVIVPGLEVETMSYGRIGARNVERLMRQPERLAGVGLMPSGAQPVLLTPEAEARLEGPAWLDTAALAQVVGQLYPLYREPGRHAARFAEQEATEALYASATN